ncbi:MAG: hypothetical protein M3Y73_20955 [Actinomycetota bacterium]|nr:hypothetical protein [Actinomycetota bacterium]
MMITLVLLTFPAVRPDLAFDGYLVITSALIAIDTASACLSDIAGQVMRLRSAAWISPALALYRAGGPTVGQPSADLRPNRDHAVVRAGGGFWTVVGLFAVAIRRPRIVVGWTSWVIAGCGLLTILTVGQKVGTGFDSLNPPLSVTVTKAALVTTGCCLSTTLAVKGRRDSNRLPHLASVGMVVVAAINLYGPFGGSPEVNLIFLTPWLFGLVLVLHAQVQLPRKARSALSAEYGKVSAANRNRIDRESLDVITSYASVLASLPGLNLLLYVFNATDNNTRRSCQYILTKHSLDRNSSSF